MLLAQAQSKTIDGVTYEVLPLGALASARVAAKVLKMAGPAFGDVASLVAASKAVSSALEGLFAGIVADLDDDVMVFCLEQFAKVTHFEVGGAKLPMISQQASHLDEHFRGRFVPMLQWLAFAASVSFPFVKAVEKPLSPADPPAAV